MPAANLKTEPVYLSNNKLQMPLLKDLRFTVVNIIISESLLGHYGKPRKSFFCTKTNWAMKVNSSSV